MNLTDSFFVTKLVKLHVYKYLGISASAPSSGDSKDVGGGGGGGGGGDGDGSARLPTATPCHPPVTSSASQVVKLGLELGIHFAFRGSVATVGIKTK